MNESDASKFAKITHTSSRCWGVIWGAFSLVTMAAAVYFHLWWLNEKDEEEIRDWGELSGGAWTILGITAGVVLLSIVHFGITKKCMIRPYHRSNTQYFQA